MTQDKQLEDAAEKYSYSKTIHGDYAVYHNQKVDNGINTTLIATCDNAEKAHFLMTAANQYKETEHTQQPALEAISAMAEKEYIMPKELDAYNWDENIIVERERKAFIKGFTSALGYSAGDNWISVDERLPEKDEYGGYLVLFDNIHGEQMQCVASFQGVPRHAFQNPPIDKRWFVFPSSGHEIKPTHWQKLQKPPIKKQ